MAWINISLAGSKRFFLHVLRMGKVNTLLQCSCGYWPRCRAVRDATQFYKQNSTSRSFTPPAKSTGDYRVQTEEILSSQLFVVLFLVIKARHFDILISPGLQLYRVVLSIAPILGREGHWRSRQPFLTTTSGLQGKIGSIRWHQWWLQGIAVGSLGARLPFDRCCF